MKKFFVVIFCLIIAFPLFQMLVGAFPEAKIEEKRPLATLEDGLSSYYDDHFGFRGSMIFLNNYLDLNIFKISPNEEVVIGRGGWMYYAPSYEANSFVVNQLDVEEVARKIYNFQEEVKKDGKKFVFILAPDKESIYPEFLREKLAGENNYEMIADVLKQNKVNTFDGLKVLREAKAKGSIVYSKNDTHWTRYGLFLTLNEMLVALGRVAVDSSGVEDVQRVGDLSLLVGFSDAETVSQPIIDEGKVVAKDRVLIFHDSFFDNEMYFKLFFKDFKKIHWKIGAIPKEYEEMRGSYDVVILEIAERDFLNLGASL